MTEWSEASEDVVRVGREMVAKYHPDLEEANIGFLFRDTAQKSGDVAVWGKASKVPARLKPLLDYDFIIWIAEDLWEGELSEQQREALVDHELCHCGFDDNGNPKMVHHDIEEFKCVVERHGIWTNELAGFGAVVLEAMQIPLALRGVEKHGGRVEAVKGDLLGSAASLEG
jgi:hypothetical protein